MLLLENSGCDSIYGGYSISIAKFEGVCLQCRIIWISTCWDC